MGGGHTLSVHAPPPKKRGHRWPPGKLSERGIQALLLVRLLVTVLQGALSFENDGARWELNPIISGVVPSWLACIREHKGNDRPRLAIIETGPRTADGIEFRIAGWPLVNARIIGAADRTQPIQAELVRIPRTGCIPVDLQVVRHIVWIAMQLEPVGYA